MLERRKKEVCKFCGGEEMRWWGNGEIIKICLICGKDFKAKRSEDKTKFHEEAEQYN